MDTALNPKEGDSRQVLVERADKELAHAYEQITRADEQIAHAEKQLSKLERDAAAGNRSLFDRPAVRGLTGLVLAGCIGVAAMAWQSSYRDTAREFIARWTPQRVATSSPVENPGSPALASPPDIQAAAEKTAPPQPELLAQAAPEDVAPSAAAVSPELTQLLQSVARDVATLGQGIEQLKASQEKMARDNATAAADLKASQEQMARVIAKASEAKASEAKASEAKASEARTSEQSLRPRVPTPSPRPTPTATRRPVPNASFAPR
jgi:hypothetical protein